MARKTDEELIVTGSPDDIADLYLRYERSVVAFFVRRGASAQEAVDLAADTFVRVIEGHRRFVSRGQGAAAAWIFGIAHNALREHRARGFRDQRLVAKLGTEALEVDPSALETIDELEFSDELRCALADLPAHQVEALLSRLVEGEAYADMAAAAQASPAAIKQRVSRGLRALRTALERTP